jgi:hypothetical protein
MLPSSRENSDNQSTCVLHPRPWIQCGSNVPFFGDTQQSYMHVGAGMFKYPSLMGIFPLPPPSPTATLILST